jgi:outer membrane usher protein
LPGDEWQEWLLAVILNRQRVSEGALLIRGPEGEWAARAVDLRAWRVRLDEDRIISFNGEPFYPLAALSPVQEAFDAAALSLELVLPPALFDATALQPGRVTTIEPRAARGGFVDYDVLYLAGDRVRSRLDGLFELGVFDPIGVLIGSFRTGDLVGDGREIVRLDTTFIEDMPPRRATLRFGDSLTAGARAPGALRRDPARQQLRHRSELPTPAPACRRRAEPRLLGRAG